ncbi:bifunctional adenosylcobinamide kinase/adenosylcobinamide-phosphate guanylyltransferase [Maribellus maritimus]|uniref:bifunctional adenosylcobinamide kinase/adenosylcobinamide-phosphate guanylyltransferase n=1 Tax=Maribellus maritimus TaxID=2870838 RepID=UPI001EEA3D0C|nr:bifunctional adenosylcobinamide kinase/adenosylcobinamide-phosphate guanylyltransferase [Maribellus maritimus]MCG6190289.1 bifunctional adenosylcobinamide kinase/adenosylcobinamide-phosphate guanylyltransferase [Maribellus maritimus]
MKNTTIHFITGGQRSGKSRFAQELAFSKSDTPVYLATARIWDDDFKERVQRHQNDRGNNWTTLEIPVKISQAEVEGKVVVLDCITLWLTNLYFDNQNLHIDEILELAKKELNELFEKNCTLFIISNEIGMGGHAENALARKFADLQGWVNQFIASVANEVTLMVSGLPLKIK